MNELRVLLSNFSNTSNTTIINLLLPVLQSIEGMIIFAEPVSNTTSNFWGGLPTSTTPEYSVLI